MNTTNDGDALERLARRRAGRKLGWYLHALVFVCVNIGLAGVAALTGRHWAVFPALGWGLGLLIHGLVALVAMPGGGLYRQLLAREWTTLQRQAQAVDPW